MSETPDNQHAMPGDDAPFVPGFDDTAERPAAINHEAIGESEIDLERDAAAAGGGRRRADRSRRSRVPGCLAVLVAMAIVVGLGWFAWGKISDALDGLGGPSDYAAGATGTPVTFEVHKGDSIAQIGRNLKSQDVIKSVDSFISASAGNQESSGIQVGFYPMHTQMSADEALDVLVDPANIVTTTVTIREGLRLTDIVAALAKATGLKKAAFTKALKDPEAIGLPDFADGNAEGYLFPATYAFGPKATPTDMLKQMVDRWRQSVGDNDVESIADSLGCEADKTSGCTPEQVMTVASLVQAEGRGADMAKIARVIYNRLQNPGTAGTVGKLQIDATVLYALGRDGNSPLTTAEIESTDSPYNTYKYKGLPPGPIGAPGDQAIQAALHPAEGDWYYYVTVNLATGETKFAKTFEEFNGYKAEYQEYCATQSDRC